jgi:hypothetical protein
MLCKTELLTLDCSVVASAGVSGSRFQISRVMKRVVFTLSVCYCCPISTKTGMCRQILVKTSNIKFNKKNFRRLYSCTNMSHFSLHSLERKVRNLRSPFCLSVCASPSNKSRTNCLIFMKFSSENTPLKVASMPFFFNSSFKHFSVNVSLRVPLFDLH